MSFAEQVADQLAEELAGAMVALAGIAGPVEMAAWPAAMADAGRRLALSLCSDDDREAAAAAADVMAALWPHVDPEEVDRADWWRTPLGRAVARTAGQDDEQVSRSVAAAMLGVHPGTVAQMAARGNLDRHPDGGILRSSVLAKIHARGR